MLQARGWVPAARIGTARQGGMIESGGASQTVALPSEQAGPQRVERPP